MKQRNREILAVILAGILILGLTFLMFALAVKGYSNSAIDLSKVSSCKGYVIDKKIILKKGKIKSNVFYFKIMLSIFIQKIRNTACLCAHTHN